jgi:tRNA-Thr(GGU) m(6)t(6)A37 methyltransferase TsaA
LIWLARPIGYVEKAGEEKDRWRRISAIRVSARFAGGLEGLSGYSHAFIIYVLHWRFWDGRVKVRPHGLRDHPPVGVFATRSPNRPNPLGLSVVRIVRVEPAEGLLEVQGLDAEQGSPVLDVKPYDYWDVVWEPRVPDWWRGSVRSWPPWSPRPGEKLL